MTVSTPKFGEPLPIEPSEEVLDFLTRRRSAPAPTLQAPGPAGAELDRLLRIAARVPDHGKLGPWRFIILEDGYKAAFADRLAEITEGRPDRTKAIAKLAKLRTPPMGVAVVTRTVQGEIPEWEQIMSAGAVCTTLLYAAHAMGYGANWITDWYAYDEQARAALGLSPAERVAGFIFIGTPSEAPLERDRPDVAARTSRWRG